jgi:DNA/RNA endonuclease YhcR with UshA esterase domain
MKIKQTTVLAAAVGLLTVVGPIFAHHGTAAYDTTQETTVKGTVTDFQFVNPHTLIFFDVKNDKGVVEHWQAEAMSPNQLTRDGWNKNTLKPGDQITVTGYRAKNGSNILRFRKMALSNGQEIKGGLDF